MRRSRCWSGRRLSRRGAAHGKRWRLKRDSRRGLWCCRNGRRFGLRPWNALRIRLVFGELAGAVMNLRKGANGSKILGGNPQDLLERGPGLIISPDLDQGSAKRDPRREIGGMAL